MHSSAKLLLCILFFSVAHSKMSVSLYCKKTGVIHCRDKYMPKICETREDCDDYGSGEYERIPTTDR